MSRRTRIARYGASIAVALIGVACGALIPGTAGGTAATVLVGIGLVGIVSLIFYEVGLTEDRDRAAGEGGGDGSGPSAAPEIPRDGEPPRASPSSGGPGRRSARPHAPKRLRGH